MPVGCTVQQIVAELGLKLADLYKNPKQPRAKGKTRKLLRATYVYCDQNGTPLKRKLRWEPKSFTQERPDGAGGWIKGIEGVAPVLYRLPELLAAGPGEIVFLTESEKDAETLRAQGFVATTVGGATAAFTAEIAEPLRGRQVVVLPHNDAPGRALAERVSSILQLLAATILVVELPGLAESGDVADWFAAGRTNEELLGLVAQVHPLEPAKSVDGPQLVADLERWFTSFVILPENTALPLALWTMHTYAFDLFEAVPYLLLTSPAEECGKTRTFEVGALVWAKPWRITGNVSEAALFRKIDRDQPTLLLDQAEILSDGNERASLLLSILDAGNRRDSSVPRCIPPTFEVKDFSTFCPKAVALIGMPDRTLVSRSVLVRMQRRKLTEKIQRFRRKAQRKPGEDLRQRVTAWTVQNLPGIKEFYDSLDLDFLEDRDSEAWEPLFAILRVADPSRWDELKTCARTLTGMKDRGAVDESLALQLLLDIRNIFDEQKICSISTHELVKSLVGDENSPWADYSNGKPLAAHALAKLLAPYGIRPDKWKQGNKSIRGYHQEQLKPAWERYIVSISDSQAPQPPPPTESTDYTESQPPQVADLFSPQPTDNKAGGSWGGSKPRKEREKLLQAVNEPPWNVGQEDFPTGGFNPDVSSPGGTCSFCKTWFGTWSGWRAHVVKGRCPKGMVQ